MAVHTKQPRAWLDKNNIPCFRADLTLEEVSEFRDILGEAFNAGLLSGWAQAVARLAEANGSLARPEPTA